ncbi:MAG: hypothetical protein ACLVDB_03360 [Anaeromassilibacillus sp.]
MVNLFRRLALHHVLKLVNISVYGQQFLCNVLIIVIRRPKECLCFFGFIDDLIARVAGLIVNAGQPQDLNNKRVTSASNLSVFRSSGT